MHSPISESGFQYSEDDTPILTTDYCLYTITHLNTGTLKILYPIFTITFAEDAILHCSYPVTGCSD